MTFYNISLLGVACVLLLSRTLAQQVVTPEVEEELLVLEIREHVLAGNAFALQTILSNVTNITTIARGFRYEADQADFFTRVTPSRQNDPDVNAIRGFADAILFGEGDPDTLAKVFTAVLFIQGPEFAPDPATTFMGLFESFSNRTAMQLILDADPTEIFIEEDDEDVEALATEGNRRRLLVAKGKPADSPLCNSCFEKSFCKKNAPWC